MRLFALLLLLPLLAACSEAKDELDALEDFTNALDELGNIAPDATPCTSDFYPAAEGNYKGSITASRVDSDGVEYMNCTWLVDMKVTYVPTNVYYCQLQATVVSLVSQSYKEWPASDTRAHQCVTKRLINTPITEGNSLTIDASEINDTSYPHQLTFASIRNAEVPLEGPYFGSLASEDDSDVSYFNLFGSLSPIAAGLELTGNGSIRVVGNGYSEASATEIGILYKQ